MSLGENIYRLRTQNNMSQGDLADALEVSRQSVSKWENDSAVPELEKLIKMAQIFGITIDELVTGEAKAAEVTPPPPQPAAAPAAQGLTTQHILGIVLLALGGLGLIIFTVVGLFTGQWILGLIITIPFLLCGILCLLCKQNAALWCGWAIYLPLWLICVMFTNRGFDFNVGGLLRCGVLLFGIVLAFFSLRKLYTDRLPLWVKILLTGAIAVTILVTVMGFVPPRTVNVSPDHNHQVIVPSEK